MWKYSSVSSACSSIFPAALLSICRSRMGFPRAPVWICTAHSHSPYSCMSSRKKNIQIFKQMTTVPLFETSPTEHQTRTPTGGLHSGFLQTQQEGNWSAWANRHPDHCFLSHLGEKIEGKKYDGR